MRMNQDERRFDFHGLGAALKRAREEKGWTQAYVAELVDRDSRTIMNIENKGQYPSFDLFVKVFLVFSCTLPKVTYSQKFAFAQRSRAMKAPVGLLSDRTVLRSKMEGLCPDKFQFVWLSFERGEILFSKGFFYLYGYSQTTR